VTTAMDEARFLALALKNPINVAILDELHQLALPDAWLVSGCLVQSVWNVLTGRAVTWSSSNISIATVVADAITAPSGTQTAQVQAIAPGSVTISATVSGGSGTLALTVVAGTAQRPQAFIRSAQGAMVAITELSGVTSSYASAINDVGQVVGSIHIGSVDHAFIWSAASGMVDIGVLPGFVHSSAGWINNSGVVVGWSSTASGSVSHAFRWSATTGMTDLGVLAELALEHADGSRPADVVGHEDVGVDPNIVAGLDFCFTRGAGEDFFCKCHVKINGLVYRWIWISSAAILRLRRREAGQYS